MFHPCDLTRRLVFNVNIHRMFHFSYFYYYHYLRPYSHRTRSWMFIPISITIQLYVPFVAAVKDEDIVMAGTKKKYANVYIHSSNLRDELFIIIESTFIIFGNSKTFSNAFFLQRFFFSSHFPLETLSFFWVFLHAHMLRGK